MCADFNPYNRSVLDHLVGWAKGTHDIVKSYSEMPLTKALSPVESMSESAREFLRERIIPLPEGISRRVRNLFFLNLDLCNELSNWLGKPTEIDGEE